MNTETHGGVSSPRPDDRWPSQGPDQTRPGCGLLRPSDVARRIPGRAGGGKHIDTRSVLGWITRGVRRSDGGRERLRASRTPGGWVIDPRDFESFIEGLTRDRCGVPSVAPPATPRPSASRRRAIEATERELDRLGV